MLLAGCEGGTTIAPPPLPAVSLSASLLRFPARLGIVLAYSTDSLQPSGWQSAGNVPPVTRPLGYDLDQRLIYFLDRENRLTTLDLEAGVTRVVIEDTRAATVGPDGAAFAVTASGELVRIARRTTTTFQAAFAEPPPAMFGTLNGQVVTLNKDSTLTLSLQSPEQPGSPVAIEAGPVTATTWGELVATASGKEVRLIRPRNPEQSERFTLPAPALDLVFSPSGHRLYLLTVDAQIVVFNRFTGDRVKIIDLPGPGDLLRPDPSGRWMLIRPSATDWVWVMDLATLNPPSASLPSAWGPTLPLVAGAATLLTADGPDVVGWNLAASIPTPVARVPGGALDTWLAIPWVPPQRARAFAAALEEASALQDSSLVSNRERATAGPTFFLQISSSQSPVWARELADQLVKDGLPATVWRPTGVSDGYRVVIGPFATRDEAEDAGRDLGRPYFTVTGPQATRP